MNYEYKTVRDLGDIFGKRVLLRLDLNVPVQNGKVIDDFRIRQAMPTLELLKEKGAKIIIVSHIDEEVRTLKPVYERLNELFPISDFIGEYAGKDVPDGINALRAREAVLCENLRQYPGEKANDDNFSKKLASLADLYINEAFSCSHRAHASIIGVPQFLPSYAGMLFHDEVTNLSEALSPLRPSLFILGGAKFETKMPLLEKFLKFYDYVFVGGALANDIFKFKGLEVGISRVSNEMMVTKDLLSKERLYYPVDVVVQQGGAVSVKTPDKVLSNEKIVDVGPKTMAELKEYVRKSKFVLWNGPLGNYEEGFLEPTEVLAQHIALTVSTRSIIGGGDTVGAISSLNLLDKFDFVSTAGGAMLEFLGDETLPGLEALSAGMKQF